MIKMELDSVHEDDALNTRASVDIEGEKLIITRKIAVAVQELVKYSLKLGKEEHLYVMTELMKALEELQSKNEKAGGGDDGNGR